MVLGLRRLHPPSKRRRSLCEQRTQRLTASVARISLRIQRFVAPQRTMSSGYSAVPHRDDGVASSRGVGGSLTSLRASSSAQHGYVAASVPAGTGGDGIFASDASADAESLLSTLPAGLGASMTGDLDTRKFRRDKLSRIFRLQRGTRCFRFTLLFLAVSGALAAPTRGVSPC